MTVVLSVHDVHTYVRGILIFPDLNHFAEPRENGAGRERTSQLDAYAERGQHPAVLISTESRTRSQSLRRRHLRSVLSSG